MFIPKANGEACALKSREYIVKGIPFIYAYNDTDINENHSFCLRLVNDSSIIDFKKNYQLLNSTFS